MTTTGCRCHAYMDQGQEDAALGPKVRVPLLLDEFAQMQVATNYHSRWSSCPLQCYAKVTCLKYERQLTFSCHAALVGNILMLQAVAL